MSLYGRVQQEVLGATLAEEHGIEVSFADSAVLYVERPRRTAEAVVRPNTDETRTRRRSGCGSLRPARIGIRFVTDAPARDMPLYLFHSVEAFVGSVERHVRRGLASGRHGWRVTDCVVTLTECAYSTADGPPSKRGPTSTSYDYRQVTPVVGASGARACGHRRVRAGAAGDAEVPTGDATGLQRLLGRWGAEVLSQTGSGELTELEARLVATRLHELQRQLPGLTGGEGVLESRFDRLPASTRRRRAGTSTGELPVAGASVLPHGAAARRR